MNPKKTKPNSQSATKKALIVHVSALPSVVKPSIDALTSADPLQRYLAEVSQYPILTVEEEKLVAAHYRVHQDKESAQKLILSNLRLVVKIAYEYRNAYMNALDLIQEGNLGLMRAVQKFDIEQGVRFTSYAAWWVRAYILKFILDNFRLVKVGTTQAQKKLFYNLMREKEKFEQMGIIPSAKQLSDSLAVKETEIIEMQNRLGSRDVELDAPNPYREGTLHNEFLAADADSAEDQAESNELREILMKNLSAFTQSLSAREKQIFSERLYNEVPKTLQELANTYGISRERLRQIEERLIKKMRDFFKSRGLSIQVQSSKRSD